MIDGQRSSAPAADQQSIEVERSLRFNLQVRSDTVDDDSRSVEAVLATENRVTVFDRVSRRIIEEILLMDGMAPTEQVPMLNDHRTFDLDELWGSVRNIRVSGKKLLCRFFFADLREIQDDAESKRLERAWLKVKQGHQRAVSVGYRVFKSAMIEPGLVRKVNGKIYTAGELPLRIATRWQPREGSLTVIQADDAAFIRNNTETFGMNETLMKYLQDHGLRTDATVIESWAHLAAFTGQQRSEAEALILEDDQVPDDFVRSAGDGTAQAPAATETLLTGFGLLETAPGPPEFTDGQRAAIDEAVEVRLRLEREQDTGVRNVFRDSGITNQPLLDRAIAERWTAGRTAQELLPMARSQRNDPVGADLGHVGIHIVRGADTNALAMGLLLREGMNLDHDIFNSSYSSRSNIPAVLRQSINSDERQQAMEIAHRYDTMSLVDLCRAGMEIDGMQVPHNVDEMIRAATSSGAVQSIFSTNVSLRVLASFMDAEDTTRLWTTEEDVPNFQSNERATMGKVGPLTKHARGGSADHMDMPASHEEFKIARYSGKMFTDEMDIIDDRLGALDSETPEDMGLAARQLRPDLCYSALFANADLLATGKALFHVDQGNIFSGGTDVMSIDAIGLAMTAMKKQRIRDRVLNLALKYVLMPADLELLFDQIVNSTETRGTGEVNGTKNPLNNKGLIGVADDRLGVAGVTDPVTDTHFTGTAVNYFATAQPGRNGAKTITVAYRRGTGRAPQINSFTKNDGTWGFGHAIKLDIGVKPLDFRGMQKHAGV